jgi:vancomycin permeability regulator SanA
MLKKIFKLILKFSLVAASLGLLLTLLPRVLTGLHASARIVSVNDAPQKSVAIVFGAGLTRDGHPTRVLRDRVETAVELYFAGKVEVLLLSGDNRFVDYNEPQAMKDYALHLGVPEDDIVLDYAGRRTYDTCYRAKEIFQVDEAILVTQGFHLPRALYTCNQLGVDATGVAAQNLYFLKRYRAYWHIRELLATPVALWEVHIARPLPVLGNPEPIFSNKPSSTHLELKHES